MNGAPLLVAARAAGAILGLLLLALPGVALFLAGRASEAGALLERLDRAESGDGSEVLIEGTALIASGADLLRAPISGDPAIAYHVRTALKLRERVTGGGTERAERPFSDERRMVPFLLVETSSEDRFPFPVAGDLAALTAPAAPPGEGRGATASIEIIVRPGDTVTALGRRAPHEDQAAAAAPATPGIEGDVHLFQGTAAAWRDGLRQAQSAAHRLVYGGIAWFITLALLGAILLSGRQ